MWIGIVLALSLFPSALWAQGLSDRCGAVVSNAPAELPGRWLDWLEDSFAGKGRRPEYGPILGRLTGFAGPFMDAEVLTPPPGVEVRPHRVIWGEGPPELGSPFPRNTLLIQVFHPSVPEAGEASATIKVEMNSPFPLFYGVGQPITSDDEGPIFLEPDLAGDLAGAPVFSSGRPRDCLIVFKGHDRPLWIPVSRGRYLEALIGGVRHQVSQADSVVGGMPKKEAGDVFDKDLAEAIRQLRAIDPKAAAEMERRAAEMRSQIETAKPGVVEEAEGVGAEVLGGFTEQIGVLEAELAGMSPAERASQAYVAGLGGSKASLLSSPSAPGSRPLVAPNLGYFDGGASLDEVQLLVVEMASGADHAPERTIIARLWQEVDWGRFRDWVEGGAPGRRP